MMSYLNRGIYQSEEYAKQLVSFEGMTFMGSTGQLNVTPTDVDGLIQLDKENAFIFFEIKHGDPRMPSGQARALTKTVDVILKGGSKAVLFLATHNNSIGTNVLAKDTIVARYYSSFGWRSIEDKNWTLKQCIDAYIKILKKKEEAA